MAYWADRRASFTDVWTRGRDALLLEQGGTQYGNKPFGDDPLGRDADLGPLGRGQTLVRTRMPEVRVVTGGRYVRLAGTLPVDQLAECGAGGRSEHPQADGTVALLIFAIFGHNSQS